MECARNVRVPDLGGRVSAEARDVHAPDLGGRVSAEARRWRGVKNVHAPQFGW